MAEPTPPRPGVLSRHAAAWGGLALLLFWFALARSGLVGRTLLADPLEVLAVLGRELDPHASGRVLPHALGTLGRALSGWAWGMGLGVAIGLLAGRGPSLERASAPTLELARAIPPIMVFPLFLVYFNYADAAYVGTIAFGCAPVVALTLARARRRLGGTSFELLEVFGASRSARGFAVAMELSPSVLLASRLALSLSLVIAIVTEMVFAPRSGLALGAYAKDAEMSFDTPAFYAAMLLVGGLGFALNAGLAWLERRLGGTRVR